MKDREIFAFEIDLSYSIKKQIVSLANYLLLC